VETSIKSPQETGRRRRPASIPAPGWVSVSIKVFNGICAIAGFVTVLETLFRNTLVWASAAVGILSVIIWWTRPHLGQRGLSWKLGIDRVSMGMVCICATVVLIHLFVPPGYVFASAAARPVRVTIDGKVDGYIQYPDTFSGVAANLKPGQVVWTFNQSVTGRQSSTAVYPNSGPCMVGGGRWTCKLWIGAAKDTGAYKVCVAVLDPPLAMQIVQGFRGDAQNYHLPLSSLPVIKDNGRDCNVFRR
jgi:hypothetical protein